MVFGREQAGEALTNRSPRRTGEEPRLRFLKLRFFSVALKGQPHTSPGHRPGYRAAAPELQALKGRNRVVGRRMVEDSRAPQGRWILWLIARPDALRGRSCYALTGRGILVSIVDPRALPWAVMSLPRWGEIQIAQHQNLRFGLVKRSTMLRTRNDQAPHRRQAGSELDEAGWLGHGRRGKGNAVEYRQVHGTDGSDGAGRRVDGHKAGARSAEMGLDRGAVKGASVGREIETGQERSGGAENVVERVGDQAAGRFTER